MIHMKEEDDCRVNGKKEQRRKKMMISYCIKNYVDKNVKKYERDYIDEQGWTTINQTVSFNIFILWMILNSVIFDVAKKKHDENVKHRE